MAFGAATCAAPATSNVVALNAPQCRQSLEQRLAAHAGLFARGRRSDGDVLWLKENAEFLNVVECTGQPGDPVLGAYEELHAGLDARLGAYPQYYRFHLSICLDLEDLGMPGDKAEAMCRWAASQGLVEAELSDLQRAEARRLLARRGIRLPDDGLRDRLRNFVDRTRTFAIPNLKAAYELTHVVFYLSEYGRRDPELGSTAVRSLTHAGILAFLNRDSDLLAEICLALRQAGHRPSPIWEAAVMETLATATNQSGGETGDDYHTYLVSSWLAAAIDRPFLPLSLQPRRTRIDLASPAARPLHAMGRALHEDRCGDWHRARWRIMARMEAPARSLLEQAERSTEEFAAFYEIFARTSRPG